jgi:hypothetical protein
MDVFTHPWIMFAPFMAAFGPISVAVVKALRGQFGRKPRHRGVYQFWDHNVDTQPNLAYQLVAEGDHLVWEGQVYFPGSEPDLGNAYLTITPDLGVMSLPTLINAGEPPAAFNLESVDLEALERFGQQMADQQTRERIAEITTVVNSVLAQHERVYHPVPA